MTPVVSALALSAPIDLHAHEGDLITYYATMVANVPFGVLVGVFGSIILIMAVNTAYVASSELLERVAHRYRMDWLIATNAARVALPHPHRERVALHGDHPAHARLAVGPRGDVRGGAAGELLPEHRLPADLSLLPAAPRTSGTTTRRALGTLLLEFVLVACFIYLALHKPYGTGLWASVVERHPRSPASRSRAATGPR